MLAPTSILFVHQGHELYGSDRTLIESVQAASEQWPGAKITVLLPSDGDLRQALLKIVSDVRVEELAIIRKSTIRSIRFRDLLGLLSKVARAKRMMSHYDLTYINTCVVLDFILASAAARPPSIIHVHEIPTGLNSALFSCLLSLSRAHLVFNSKATRQTFWVPCWKQSAVVWNGVAPQVRVSRATVSHHLKLLMVGRMNAWKGQALLLNAVASLPADDLPRIRVRLVGGTYAGQDHFRSEIDKIIESKGLCKTVEVHPFTPQPQDHYCWADLVVVPSLKPEPFGLVAIEAMAAGRAVIGADHGGLSEIIIDQVTGHLFAPGSSEELAYTILSYLHDPAKAAQQGDAGFRRFKAEFDDAKYKKKIVSAFEMAMRIPRRGECSEC